MNGRLKVVWVTASLVKGVCSCWFETTSNRVT